MSDGALSQEEIDSLLAGLDGGPGPQAAPSGGGRQGSALSPQDAQAFKAILESTLSAQSQNLSMITGLPVTIQSPTVDGVNEGWLPPGRARGSSGGFSAFRRIACRATTAFVMSKETAIKIASLANKDETLSDLDDMAVSAVQECVSTLAGTQITVVSEKTGNRNITAGVAEGILRAQGDGEGAHWRLPTSDLPCTDRRRAARPARRAFRALFRQGRARLLRGAASQAAQVPAMMGELHGGPDGAADGPANGPADRQQMGQQMGGGFGQMAQGTAPRWRRLRR